MSAPSEWSLAGRNVLVTGASRGIGKAAAVLLAKAGARVAIHYGQNEKEARDTLSQCEQAADAAGGRAGGGRGAGSGGHAIFRADVGRAQEVRALVDEVRQAFGAIHVLVNNAGVSRENPFDEPDFEKWEEAWRRTIDVNLMSAAHATWCVIPEMKARGEGRVINVASRAAFRGETGAPDYGAAKAAMVNLTRSLARAMGQYGIVASCVAPGWVETDMARGHFEDNPGLEQRAIAEVPLGRLASVDDCAGAILYLAGPMGAYLNGVTIPVNGGSYVA
jgi:NAD(P)-dependent dehydrogenase (short-subunit alcohol dehydrogenase family)